MTGPMPGRPDHVAVMFAGNNGNINCRVSALGYAPPATAAPPAPAEEEKARPTDAELAVALGLGPPHDVTVGAGAIGVRFKPSSGLGPQVLAVFEHCPCPESFALGACVVAVDGRDARELTPAAMCEYLKHQALAGAHVHAAQPARRGGRRGRRGRRQARRRGRGPRRRRRRRRPRSRTASACTTSARTRRSRAGTSSRTARPARWRRGTSTRRTPASSSRATRARQLRALAAQPRAAAAAARRLRRRRGRVLRRAEAHVPPQREQGRARGQAGEVMGPMPGRPDHVAVMFAGNNGNINCRVSALSYEPVAIAEPPAPAGADAPRPPRRTRPRPPRVGRARRGRAAVVAQEAVPPRARSLRKSVARLTGMRAASSRARAASRSTAIPRRPTRAAHRGGGAGGSPVSVTSGGRGAAAAGRAGRGRRGRGRGRSSARRTRPIRADRRRSGRWHRAHPQVEDEKAGASGAKKATCDEAHAPRRGLLAVESAGSGGAAAAAGNGHARTVTGHTTQTSARAARVRA